MHKIALCVASIYRYSGNTWRARQEILYNKLYRELKINYNIKISLPAFYKS